ncbi:hypothetical protein BDY19DRAFT_864524, partial [Irpex rosettiformis]
IYRLGRVSQTLRLTTLSCYHRLFNIHKRLSNFFEDPISFRRLQFETGMVISGSFALAFFHRCVYIDSDLDLYVVDGAHNWVGLWLMDNGY